MDLKLGSLPLPHPGVRRGLLDLRAVLAPEGSLGGPGLEVDHERPPAYGQALLCADAGLRAPLAGKLHVPEPLRRDVMLFHKVVGGCGGWLCWVVVVVVLGGPFGRQRKGMVG